MVLGVRPGPGCAGLRRGLHATPLCGSLHRLHTRPSYVLNLSGTAASLGTWLAGLGAASAFLSGLLGWFGVTVAGSDTSPNALFGGALLPGRLS